MFAAAEVGALLGDAISAVDRPRGAGDDVKRDTEYAICGPSHSFGGTINEWNQNVVLECDLCKNSIPFRRTG